MKITHDMLIFARHALGLSDTVSIEIFPLEGRGSDRIFYRLTWNSTGSAILMHYDRKRVENTYYADIALFLRRITIPVPKLISHDTTLSLILMEDLGNTDLFSLKDSPWDQQQTLYHKVLAYIQKLHAFPEKEFPWNHVKLMEGFNHELYRWERDYFRHYFVEGVCAIALDKSFAQELEKELAGLADRLLRRENSFIHRDLQSQNIMVCNNEPFLIDFQGMRLGSLFYDLGSLLCDPYVNLSLDKQRGLLSFYYETTKTRFDAQSFEIAFWEASIQRLMQALGAYGFLGIQKGLQSFLQHIPSGLEQLLRATSHVSSVPRLKEISLECQRVIEHKKTTLGTYK